MPLQTTPEQPAPVRQIATLLQQYVDRLGAVWVEGQIAQLNRRQGMSTVFLTLRDPIGDVSLTVSCPRQVVDSADPPVVEGASVVVHGRPRYYTNRGSLSLVVDDIRMVGLGELLARLERRRQLLAAEGLFARERKRPVPFLPGTVGLITARASAAERDVVESARRRWPAVRFETAYAVMQGPGSAREVIECLARLDRDPAVDVVVIARGGGSFEDLLPFSDEGLVRAVAQARTPVVSAIGHEPDSPLLDLVADLRAELGMSLLLIAHDIGIVSTVADEIVVLYAGVVAETGPAQAVLRSPAHPYTRALLRSRPPGGSRGLTSASTPPTSSTSNRTAWSAAASNAERAWLSRRRA